MLKHKDIVRHTLVHMGIVMTLRAATLTPSATHLSLSLLLCLALPIRAYTVGTDFTDFIMHTLVHSLHSRYCARCHSG